MGNKVERVERKTSLGNAVIISVVMLVAGLLIGANFESWFGGFGQYLGVGTGNSSKINWSELDEVYNKLASSYNGDISESAVIEGAKKV